MTNIAWDSYVLDTFGLQRSSQVVLGLGGDWGHEMEKVLKENEEECNEGPEGCAGRDVTM